MLCRAWRSATVVVASTVVARVLAVAVARALVVASGRWQVYGSAGDSRSVSGSASGHGRCSAVVSVTEVVFVLATQFSDGGLHCIGHCVALALAQAMALVVALAAAL